MAALYFSAGATAAALTLAYEMLLRRAVNGMGLDLLHFSLHPLSARRSAIFFALLLFNAALVWAGAFVIRLARITDRRAPPFAPGLLTAPAVVAGAGAAAAIVARMWPGLPIAAAGVALLATIVCAAALSRPRGAFRRASYGTRLALLYAALLLPALALYPSLAQDVTAAKERVVAGTFTTQALAMRQDLSRQSDRALEEIDAMSTLPSLVAGTSDVDTPTTDQAFTLWSATALAEHRITSAIELYAANGRLVSRFALNLPEYNSTLHLTPGCGWTTFEEVTSFAASDRHVLRASRSICTSDGVAGSIVVRVMLDYGTLPFISSQRPDIEPGTTDDEQPAETTLGRDVEFTLYGWSRAPLYTFSTGIWPLAPAVFEELVTSREPFWTTITRDDGRSYRVHIASDRSGIYALGYPAITLFGHLLNLAELIVLTTVLWVLLIGSAMLFNAATARTPATGRALLREIRSSFYRKLWLAFVGAAALPVLILAFATRTYFANQFSASVKDDAVRTATVAQRLVEDYAALQPHQSGTLEVLDDQVMILVSQAIDQAVNLFDPTHLQATSEPDLFASGVLSGADARRRIPRGGARPAADVRRRGGSGPRVATCWPRRACAPGSAKGSSRCR